MTSVTHARESLGQRLRELRQRAGLSGKHLAEALGWQASKVTRLELGQQTPSDSDLRAWAAGTGADQELEDLLAELHTLETRYAEWRRQLRGGATRRQKQLMALDEGVRLVRGFEPVVVPGLLQTAGYAAHRIGKGVAYHGAPDDIEAAVATRMERQAVLYRPGKLFHFVITEAVLRYHLCPTDVLAGQLDRLLALMSLPNVRLGIIRFTVEPPVTPLHGFWIHDDRLVLVETLAAELNLQQPQEIRFYTDLFLALADAAVYGAAARACIVATLADLGEFEAVSPVT